MMLFFDHQVDRLTQRARVMDYRRPGRKHLHQPPQKVKQRRVRAAQRRANMRSAKDEKYQAKVRAYWCGELPLHPLRALEPPHAT